MNFRDSVLDRCKRIKKQVTVVSSDHPLVLSDIQVGIVFVWATWSGQARLALDTLCEVLAEAGFESIRLYVADNDAESTEKFMDSIGQTPAGVGETFWVKNGQILARFGNYNSRDKAVLMQNNRKLIPEV